MKNNNMFDIWNDPNREEQWREEDREREYDEERFKAADYYRGRAGETFVCTHQQFEEWDKEKYREVEFDKLYPNEDPLFCSYYELNMPNEDLQNEFDKKIAMQTRESIRLWNDVFEERKIIGKRSALRDGSRQLKARQRSKEIHKRTIKYMQEAA